MKYDVRNDLVAIQTLEEEGMIDPEEANFMRRHVRDLAES